MSLINVYDLADGLILAHDALAQITIELLRIKSCLRWIQLLV
jgi:hypothetical protein